MTGSGRTGSGMTLAALLDFLWRDYVAITPSARRIHDLMEARGERIVNDHVAFRTFDLAPIDLESLAAPFAAFGYLETGRYDFPEKKLRARSYAHPGRGVPYVFISELEVGAFSPAFQEIARALVAQVPKSSARSLELLTAKPSWSAIPFDDYQTLLAESQYGAWLAAFALRINHCTVSVNYLSTFETLQALNEWLIAEGFPMNESGGLVKGSAEILLEQSSILADRIEWGFADGKKHDVPSCYYEFARRYPDPQTGGLYAGFFGPSANKIFESTDTPRVR